jgi:hypothetical protein
VGNWTNLLGYQLTWFVTVKSVSRDVPWIGVATASAFCVCQLLVSRRRPLDLRLMATAALLGTMVDGLLATTGLLHYSGSSVVVPLLGCPVWILALWVAFATTVPRSLGWLRGRPWFAAALGALGGPLAYWAAARGWGAVKPIEPLWPTLLALAVGWGIALVILVEICDRYSTVSGTPSIEEADFP